MSRSIDNIEELERIEREEAERESARQLEASISSNPIARSSIDSLITLDFLKN